jgi:hypothetical protein
MSKRTEPDVSETEHGVSMPDFGLSRLGEVLLGRNGYRLTLSSRGIQGMPR